MILPAISIKEPWASMIANGEKSIEVRSWKTNHRGRIILCASAKPESDIAGHAFALAEVADVRPIQPGDKVRAGGVYVDGAYAWELKNIRRFNPFPVKGRLGIFKIDTATRSPI